jgi:7-cyano-7-deazaguanine synthase
MDSCVSAAVAIAAGHHPCFLHVTYGQLTAARELRAFNEIADFYCVNTRLVADIAYLRQIGGSALTDPSIPLSRAAANVSAIPSSYVPFRNANLLAIAASWAEVASAGYIYIGAVEEDSSGYPDCRESFFRAFTSAIREGTRPETKIEIVTPVLQLRKRDIVETGVRLKAPLALTWSCYRAEELACGTCESCRLRLRGFAEAGVADPIPYAAT